MIKPDLETIKCYSFDKWAQNVISDKMDCINLLDKLDIHDECDDGLVTIKTIDYGVHHCFVRAYVPTIGWQIYETTRHAGPRDHMMHGGVTHLIKIK